MSEDVLDRLERLRGRVDSVHDCDMGEDSAAYESALYDAAPALIAVARAARELVKPDVFGRCRMCPGLRLHSPDCPVPAAQTALEPLLEGTKGTVRHNSHYCLLCGPSLDGFDPDAPSHEDWCPVPAALAAWERVNRAPAP